MTAREIYGIIYDILSCNGTQKYKGDGMFEQRIDIDRMEQAVALEDFETAAKLRDQIRALSVSGEEEA